MNMDRRVRKYLIHWLWFLHSGICSWM